MEPIHILLVGDDPLARMGLAMLLGGQPDCVVIGQVASSILTDEFSDLDNLPDVVVWDVGWAAADGLPAWEAIPVPVVALVADEGQTAVLWSAGVRALLRREMDLDRLWTAVQAAVHGLIVLDPELSAGLITAVSPITLPTDDLTPREREVLQHLAKGLTNKAIAQRLAVSEHTIKFHVNALMGKLGAQSRTEAVVLATRQGLIVL
ncbi:MAG: response regulator transcription factor [Chloroflexi bacterium]|nr:response regulator transcription factor [Chloroflexota bacterium]MBP7589984.1 response regulator transcription factor [Chloroflexota bacterium]